MGFEPALIAKFVSENRFIRISNVHKCTCSIALGTLPVVVNGEVTSFVKFSVGFIGPELPTI